MVILDRQLDTAAALPNSGSTPVPVAISGSKIPRTYYSVSPGVLIKNKRITILHRMLLKSKLKSSRKNKSFGNILSCKVFLKC